jgi:hypothetical protein
MQEPVESPTQNITKVVNQTSFARHAAPAVVGVHHPACRYMVLLPYQPSKLKKYVHRYKKYVSKYILKDR